MGTLVDDVGSFPLPQTVNRQTFNKSRDLARHVVAEGKGLPRDGPARDVFCRTVVDSFRIKSSAGLDVTGYPQHYDMYRQFMDIIEETMKEGTFAVDEKQAIIPEIYAISEAAKGIAEETGRQVRMRACVTGPMELYLREVGATVHEDALMMFAETVRRFAKQAVLDSKYVRTEVVSIDEPSFGFQEIATDRDVIIAVLEKAFDFKCKAKQIHLHSSAKIADLLDVAGLDVLAFEFAASPCNIESVSKRMLEGADKRVRVGIARTDVDAIAAELHDRNLGTSKAKLMVDSVKTMRRRFRFAKETYGDCLTFSGPDCGLGGWPTQDAARLLLQRAVQAVKS